MARFDNTPPPCWLKGNALATLVRIFVLAAFLVVAVQSSADAANWRNMEVYNNTGYTIHELYITALKQRNWGQDLLGKSVLYNGGRATFRYDANYQYYELRVVFSDGSVREWTGDKAMNFRGSTMLVLSPGSNGHFKAKVD